MKTFCEIYVKNILPAIRALLARELIQKYSKTQMEAAKILDITQASINYYLYGRRASKITEALDSISEIKSMVKKLAKKISENSGADVGELLCEFCMVIKSNKEYLTKVLNAIGVEESNVYVFIPKSK